MRYKYIYLLYRCQPDFSIGLNIGETKMEKLLAHKYYYFCINGINYNDYFELEITQDNKFNESEPFYIRVYEYEQYFYIIIQFIILILLDIRYKKKKLTNLL